MGLIDSVVCFQVLTRLLRVSPEALRSRSRRALLVQHRGTIALVLRRLGLSWPAIGALMCRDHSTMIHDERRARRRVDSGLMSITTIERLQETCLAAMTERRKAAA